MQKTLDQILGSSTSLYLLFRYTPIKSVDTLPPREDEIRGFFHHFLCSGMDVVACYRSGLKITSGLGPTIMQHGFFPLSVAQVIKSARNESSNAAAAATWPPANRLTCISDFNPR